MAKAKNKVISGAYQGYVCAGTKRDVWISPGTFSMDMKYLRKNTVESYELITEDKVKSGSSAILRGAAGAALLGPVGLLAGLTAKSNGIYNVAVMWSDGKKSLIEMDDTCYKALVASMF